MNKQNKSRSKNKSLLFLGLIAFAIFTIAVSCEEDINSLGVSILPEGDQMLILYDSTITFNTFVVKRDTIATSNLSSYTIGMVDDTYFGKFNGKFAGQFLPLEKDNLIETYDIDSAILYVAVDSIYGLSNEISFDIYELDKEIDKDITYYSNSNVSGFCSELNKLNTSYSYRGDSVIAFHLTDALVERLTGDTLYYEHDTTFKDQFKGLAIIPTLLGSDGCIFNINLASPDTKILLYHTKDTTIKTIAYNFHGQYKSHRKFAEYSYDYSTSLINDYLTNAEDENDTLGFFQGGVGVYSRLTFSNIKPWINDTIKYSILNASLILPIHSDDNIDVFHPVGNLIHYYYEGEDSAAYTTEDYSNNEYAFDGKYNEEKEYYHFDISKHLMRVLNGEIKDSSINVGIKYQTIYPHRAIFKTGDNIKLKITYTKH